MILVVDLGHGISSSGSSYIILQISFGEVLTSIEEPQKKRGTPLSKQYFLIFVRFYYNIMLRGTVLHRRPGDARTPSESLIYPSPRKEAELHGNTNT